MCVRGLWVHCVLSSRRDLSRNEIRVIHRDAFLSLTALTNLWVRLIIIIIKYCYATSDHAEQSSPVTYRHSFLLTCAELNCLCILIWFDRDLSMNSLAVIPTSGLSSLSQLKLSGNLQMKNGLTAKNLPKLRWERSSGVDCRVLLSEVFSFLCWLCKWRRPIFFYPWGLSLTLSSLHASS